MANKLTKKAVSVFHPGQQASAGRPAYCYITGVVQWGPGSSRNGEQNSVLTETMTPAEAHLQLQKFTTGRQSAGYSATYRLVCFAAVAPQPQINAYNRVDLRAGWNASGDSLFNQAGDFTFTFDYDRFPVGVIVGIAPYPASGTLPSSVTGGVYLRDGAIEVMAGGTVVAIAPYVPSDRPAIMLARQGDQIVVRVGDWQHAVLGVPGEQVAQIRALLYVAGDYVENPRFVVDTVGRARGTAGTRLVVPDIARARGRLGLRLAKTHAGGRIGMTGRAVAVVDHVARARGSVCLSGAIAAPGASGVATLPGLSLYAGRSGSASVGAARVGLPGLAVDANGGYAVPTYAGGGVSLPGLMLGGVVQVGEVGNASLALPGLSLIGADFPYGQASLALPALRAYGQAPVEGDGRVAMYETVHMGDRLNGRGLLYAIINSELSAGSSITFSMMLGAALYDSLLLQDQASFAATLEAVIRSGISLSDQAARGDWSPSNAHYAAVQYATNVLTGAVTRFDGFNFSSFCRVGQETYGVAPDGLYRIGHNDVPIDAIVEFAAIGADSAAAKKLSYVYVGIATDGALYVAVDADDGTRQVYEAIESQGMWRAQAAKGVTSRQWTVTLQLSQATQADLDSVEWIAPATARRFGR